MLDPSEITVNGKKLSAILKSHEKWMNSKKGEEANLQGASLQGAYLHGAYLQRAYLQGANLQGAYLHGANLQGANLQGANLQGADLQEADLQGAKNIPDYIFAVTGILPDGDLIGWKKCADGVIAKLLIPAKARRSNATGRKCRAEYVRVLALYKGDKELPKITVVGSYMHTCEGTKYQVGKTVKCHEWDEDRWAECSGGIHFFITRYEAEQF
jgi:hypothetical protein